MMRRRGRCEASRSDGGHTGQSQVHERLRLAK
jgi:hypothetical protein